jgi:hypothetical protein
MGSALNPSSSSTVQARPLLGVSMRTTPIHRLVALLTVLALAFGASSAYAGDATSAIIADVAKDGKVDGHYTKAQLQQALKSPLLAQYGGTGGVAGVQGANAGNSGNVAGVQSAPPAPSQSGTLPFTGADIALFLVVGGVLVAAGVGLRRISRNEDAPTA